MPGHSRVPVLVGTVRAACGCHATAAVYLSVEGTMSYCDGDDPSEADGSGSGIAVWLSVVLISALLLVARTSHVWGG